MNKNSVKIFLAINVSFLMACGGNKNKSSEIPVESSVPLNAGSTILRSTAAKEPVIASIEVTPDVAKKSAEVSTTVTSPNSSPDKIKLVVTYAEKSTTGSPKNATSVKFDAASKKHIHSVASLEEGKTYVVSVEATDEKNNKATGTKEFTFGTKTPPPSPKTPPALVATAPTIDLQLAQDGTNPKIIATIKATSATSAADKISLTAITYEKPAPATVEWTKAKAVPVGQPYIVENLGEGKTYVVYVKAIDEAKKETVASKELTIEKPKAQPTAAELEIISLQKFLDELCQANPGLATKIKDFNPCTFKFSAATPQLYFKYQISSSDYEIEISSGKLILERLDLVSIPDSIGELVNLVSADLHSNSLKEIPDSVEKLTKLTDLNLRFNQLNPFPEPIAKLVNLENLNLNNNNIPEIPDVFADLTKLVLLDIGGNKIESGKVLPPSIGALASLTNLYIDNNNLSSLPDELGNLPKLISLKINGNPFNEVPKIVGNLKLLQHLDISNCNLPTLDAWIGELQLTQLDASYNEFKAFPAVIQKLTKLQMLKLKKNHIPSIPVWVNNLNELTYIDLDENKLKKIPLQKTKLTKLSNLFVSKNQLPAAEKIRLKKMFDTIVTTD